MLIIWILILQTKWIRQSIFAPILSSCTCWKKYPLKYCYQASQFCLYDQARLRLLTIIICLDMSLARLTKLTYMVKTEKTNCGKTGLSSMSPWTKLEKSTRGKDEKKCWRNELAWTICMHSGTHTGIHTHERIRVHVCGTTNRCWDSSEGFRMHMHFAYTHAHTHIHGPLSFSSTCYWENWPRQNLWLKPGDP
jgi:hypothetical protein